MKTAELVRAAQPIIKDEDGVVVMPVVAQINELAEQDFGSYEGVSFLARQPGSKVSGKEAHRTVHKDDPGFVDMESRESMTRRVDVFLDDYLMPVVQAIATSPVSVAIVSHGITLSVLWRRLLHRLPPRSVSLHPEVSSRYTGIDLERIGGWSNTGYLELEIAYTVITQMASPAGQPLGNSLVSTEANTQPQIVTLDSSPNTSDPAVFEQDFAHDDSTINTTSETTKIVARHVFVGWTVAVHAVNSRAHLTGLKRTGGGVGSARFDDKQKSIDTFFKRRKVE